MKGLRVAVLASGDTLLIPRPQLLSAELARHGFEVALYAGRHNEGLEFNPTWLPRTYFMDSTALPRKLRTLGLWLSAAKVARYRPDVIVGFDMAIVPAILAKWLWRRSRAVAYHLEYYTERKGFSGYWIEFLKRFEHQCDLIVDVDEGRLKRRIATWRRVGDTVVIRNFYPRKSAAELRPEREAGPTRFVFIGSVRPQNNPVALLRAAGRSTRPLQLDLFLTGDAATIVELRETAARLGLDGAVAVHDSVPRSEMMTLLSRFDVGTVWYPFVDLRGDEAFAHENCAPNKLGEYLASGLAILATNNASLRLVEERGFGRQCDPGDSASIDRALAALADPRIREAAKVKVRRAFEVWANYETECAPFINKLNGWSKC